MKFCAGYYYEIGEEIARAGHVAKRNAWKNVVLLTFRLVLWIARRRYT